MAISTTELVGDARETLGSQISTEAHPDANMKAYVNKAIRKLDKVGDWIHKVMKASLVTNGSTTAYAVPFQKQTLAVILGGAPVPYCNLEEYFSATDNSGMFGIQGEEAYTPSSGTYVIVYRGMTPRITTVASGSIDLPEYCYEAMLYATLYYGFMHVKDFDKMRENKALFDEEMERLKRTFGNIQPNNMVRLGSGDSYKF